MDQQGSYIGIALAADAPQFAVIAAAEFARGHAQPGAELAASVKPFGLTNRSNRGQTTIKSNRGQTTIK